MPAAEAKNRICSQGDLLLYGEIGNWDDDLDAESVVNQLEQLDPNNITVRIHSGGGVIIDGLAIYNRLKQSKAHITVYIDGVAASIASVIAMAGDTIYMPENSWLMIHKPWNLAAGTADDMRKHVDVLDGFEDTLVNIYQTKTGLDANTIKNYLENETWLNADDAKRLGFIDEIIEDVKAAASIDLKSFNNIPEPLKQILGNNKMTDLTQDKEKSADTAKAKAEIKHKTKQVAETQIVDTRDEWHEEYFSPLPYMGYSESFNPHEKLAAYSEALACRHTNIKPSDHARYFMGKSISDIARNILENSVGLNTSNMSNQTVLAKVLDFLYAQTDRINKHLHICIGTIPTLCKK